jgi:transposase
MIHPARIREKALKIRQQGKSLKEVSETLGIAKSTASVWCRKVKLPIMAQKILERKRQNRFFKIGNHHWQKAKRNVFFTRVWDDKKIKQAENFYNSGLSVRQVSEKMKLSHSSINHAMRRYHLKRRTAAQTQQIQFYRSPLSFKPKNRLTAREKLLKTAGLMLYWAEGAKKNKAVDFVNSNPDMIKLFTKFIRQIYEVNELRLRCQIYCYPSHDIQKLTGYWSKVTKIPTKQFTKPYIRNDGGDIRDKMKYGLVHVRYSDKRLFELIMKEIRQLSYNI